MMNSQDRLLKLENLLERLQHNRQQGTHKLRTEAADEEIPPRIEPPASIKTDAVALEKSAEPERAVPLDLIPRASVLADDALAPESLATEEIIDENSAIIEVEPGSVDIARDEELVGAHGDEILSVPESEVIASSHSGLPEDIVELDVDELMELDEEETDIVPTLRPAPAIGEAGQQLSGLDEDDEIEISDDVEEDFEISDDVEEELEISDDVEEELEISDDVEEELEISDDVEEELELDDAVELDDHDEYGHREHIDRRPSIANAGTEFDLGSGQDTEIPLPPKEEPDWQSEEDHRPSFTSLSGDEDREMALNTIPSPNVLHTPSDVDLDHKTVPSPSAIRSAPPHRSTEPSGPRESRTFETAVTASGDVATIHGVRPEPKAWTIDAVLERAWKVGAP